MWRVSYHRRKVLVKKIKMFLNYRRKKTINLQWQLIGRFVQTGRRTVPHSKNDRSTPTPKIFVCVCQTTPTFLTQAPCLMSRARCRSSTTWICTEDSHRRRSSSWSPGVFAKYQQIAITNTSDPTPIAVDPTSVHRDPPPTILFPVPGGSGCHRAVP